MNKLRKFFVLKKKGRDIGDWCIAGWFDHKKDALDYMKETSSFELQYKIEVIYEPF